VAKGVFERGVPEPSRGGHTVAWGRSGVRGGRRFFSDEISRAPGGAVESGRSDSPRRGGMLSPGFPFLPPVSSGPLRKPGSVLLGEKDFLPIGGWAAKW
jgi:hypothetical protein